MGGEAYIQPQLIEETESLLMTPFFRTSEEYNDLEDLSGEEYGLKTFIYRACCRILAEARAEDRAIACETGGYQSAEWNANWQLTSRKLAEVAFRYEDRVTFLARQLAIVNRIDDYIEKHWDTMKQRLREDQQMYMFDIVPSLQKPPRAVLFTDEQGDTQRYMIHGTTIIAPTGFGKTRLIEACTRMMSPGEPLLDARGGDQPLRVVLVTPSIATLKQNVRALREALPNVAIGEVHADKRETSAAIPVVTIDMFTRLFEDGKIDGNPVDVLTIDEGHHLTEPQFRETFVTQWRGMSLVFTATPAYDLHRDVRAIIPHVVEKSDTMTCIERGTLNDGQIFTFIIDDAEYEMLLTRYDINPSEAQKKAIIREVVDTLVIEFITPLLEEGRRGIVFCEPGTQAFYARRLAERLSRLSLGNGKQVRAASMDSYNNNQLDVMDDFHAGKLDVVTAVDTGREGLDASFDFVIINCNIISRLRGHQITGRGTRPSEKFPVTVYGQFSVRLLDTRFEKLYSIEESFGRHRIEQGQTLRSGGGAPREQGETVDIIDMSAFPEIIKELLQQVDHRPVGEVFMGVNRGRRVVTEDAIPLSEIIENRFISETYAKKLLRAAGFPWQGQMEKIDDERRLVHYYSPAARDYLHTRIPAGELLTIAEVAERLGVSAHVVRYVTETNNIAGRRVPRNLQGPPPICLNELERAKIAEIVKKMPGTQPGDRTLRDVARELGVNEQVVWKLLGTPDDNRYLINNTLYLTAAEAKQAKTAFESVPVAGPGEKYLAKLAEETGASWQVIERNLTPEERAAAVVKRYKDPRGFNRKAPHWPAEMSQAIATRMERFRPRPLPAHLMPSSAMRVLVRNYTSISSDEIARILQEAGFSTEEVLVTGARAMKKCLSWQAVEYLQRTLGASKGKCVVNLDYSRLPTGSDDLDPDKIAYAQSIQRQLLPGEQLQKYTE